MKTSERSEAKTALQQKLTDKKVSALKKYREMVVGNKGFFYFLKYECIMLLCNGVPGALGYLLRKILYKRLFAAVGRGVVFGRNMTIRHPHKIRIGDRCILDDLVVLDAKGDANDGITIGNDVIIARNTVVSCKGGNISIGDNSNISLNCMIHSEKDVRIGPRNLWAAYCYIIGGGKHEFDRVDLPIIQQGSVTDGIVMEEDLWLGARVTVMDGCHIGKGSILGAGAIVNKDIPPYKIAVGMPARVVRSRGKPGAQNVETMIISREALEREQNKSRKS